MLHYYQAAHTSLICKQGKCQQSFNQASIIVPSELFQCIRQADGRCQIQAEPKFVFPLSHRSNMTRNKIGTFLKTVWHRKTETGWISRKKIGRYLFFNLIFKCWCFFPLCWNLPHRQRIQKMVQNNVLCISRVVI